MMLNLEIEKGRFETTDGTIEYSEVIPQILSTNTDVVKTAFELAKAGVLIVPVKNKLPVLKGWNSIDRLPPTVDEVRDWISKNLLEQIGIVAGYKYNDHYLHIIDFDSETWYQQFRSHFPELAQTYTNASGKGYHAFFLSKKSYVLGGERGKIEFTGMYKKGSYGGQTIIPPSPYIKDGKVIEGVSYRVFLNVPILKADNLDDLYNWCNEVTGKTKKDKMPVTHNSGMFIPDEIGTPYAIGAFKNVVGILANSVEGTRNDNLNKAAFTAGQFIATGELDLVYVLDTLTDVGLRIGLDPYHVRATIDSGITAGKEHPRSTPKNENEIIPTNDELGEQLIARWDGNRKYFFGQWYTYRDGYWQVEKNLSKELWDVMIENKHTGLKPSLYVASNIENYIKSRLIVDDEKIDNGEKYVNLTNGLFNLENGVLEPHNPDLYLTGQMSFAYDENADCPQWQQFLEQTLITPDGKTDHEMIDLLQEAFGYSMTTDTSYRVSFWLVGESGTGKSTVLNVLETLMGSAATQLDLSSLDVNRYQLADIPGKRVITCFENKTGTTLEDNVFKTLVAGEQLPVRQIRQETMRIKPQAKIWWAMNSKPRVDDRSEAVYSRTIIIPFNNVVPREKWDLRLHQKLAVEASGIFNWAIQGLHRLYKNQSFTQPKQIVEAVKEYKSENDVEAAFMNDWIVSKPGNQILASDLYKAYVMWSKENGHHPKSATKVAQDWKRLGLKKDRVTKGNVYLDIELSEYGLKMVIG